MTDIAGDMLGDSSRRLPPSWREGDRGSFLTEYRVWCGGCGDGARELPGEGTCRGEGAGDGECRGDCNGDCGFVRFRPIILLGPSRANIMRSTSYT